MRRTAWGIAGLLPLLAFVAACQGSEAGPDAAPSRAATAVADAAAQAESAATDSAPAPDAVARSEKEENDLYQFGFAYPVQAAAIPGLKALLDKRLDAAKADLVSSARSDKAEAAKDSYPYRAHSWEATWKVVTDLPDFLSLSADLYEFTGGAHGMSNFDSLVWDRRADTVREPLDLFTSKDALRVAIQAPFCDALDQERAKRRGEPVDRDSGQSFSECIDPVASTVILGSSNRKTFDRIGVLVAPYEAGPYAEGSYEVTLPVTGKVMAALKPQYREAFSVKP